MLSQFPANDLERPATKEFVRAENAVLRADFRTEITDLRTDMIERFGAVEKTFHADMVTHLKWIVGLMVSAQAVMVAAIALFT